MTAERMSSWSDEPSRLETTLAVVFAIWVVLTFLISTVLWGWLAIGVVAAALAMGPVADSALSIRVGAWFRAIGVAGRVLATIAFVVILWTAMTVLGVPETPIRSFGTGGLLAFAVIVLTQTVRSRGIQ